MRIEIQMRSGFEFEYTNAENITASETQTVISSAESTIAILENIEIVKLSITADCKQCVNFSSRI